MALEIRVSGPGLDVTRRIAKGDEPIVLGRDPECDVCLPDPERTVSRRHLEVWSTGGELQFHVVSTVNGIEMAFGEAPPGARGVLPKGQSIKVGDYLLDARELDPTIGGAPGGDDPWDALHREHSGAAATPVVPAPGEDDPFSEWGFHTTLGAANPQAAGADPLPQDASDMATFFRGLGLDAATVEKGELEAMGRIVRVLVLGVLDLHASVTGVKDELRSEDRTMLAPKDNNPLKTTWPSETKLRYLFGGRIAAAGYVPAERAIREVLVDLLAHNAASGTAARAAVEGTLRDMAPGALKARLLGEGAKLFEGTRAWDAFCKWHDAQSREMASWVQRQIDRHFVDAYLRESLRIRRARKR